MFQSPATSMFCHETCLTGIPSLSAGAASGCRMTFMGQIQPTPEWEIYMEMMIGESATLMVYLPQNMAENILLMAYSN